MRKMQRPDLPKGVERAKIVELINGLKIDNNSWGIFLLIYLFKNIFSY